MGCSHFVVQSLASIEEGRNAVGVQPPETFNVGIDLNLGASKSLEIGEELVEGASLSLVLDCFRGYHSIRDVLDNTPVGLGVVSRSIQ